MGKLNPGARRDSQVDSLLGDSQMWFNHRYSTDDLDFGDLPLDNDIEAEEAELSNPADESYALLSLESDPKRRLSSFYFLGLLGLAHVLFVSGQLEDCKSTFYEKGMSIVGGQRDRPWGLFTELAKEVGAKAVLHGG